MARDIIASAEEAVDPGEPEAVSSEEEAVGEEDGFPDAQIIVDEETGQHFIAFEIDPDAFDEEGGEEK